MDKIALYNICRFAVEEKDNFECLVINLKSGQVFSDICFYDVEDYYEIFGTTEKEVIESLMRPDSTFVIRSNDINTFISVDEIEYVNLIYKNDD